MTMRHLLPLSLVLLLTGCGMLPPGADETGSSPATTATISGAVHGGQQPLSGATIQLFAVGNTGLKSASTHLVPTTVLTGNDGTFNITGLWNCNDASTYGSDPLLYITSTGGNPGLGAGQSNPTISMLVALGPCSTVGAGTFISINELTSAASIFALAPFMQDSTHIGAPASGMAGLRSAFQTVHTLVDTANGVSPGPGIVSGEAVPTKTLNTLADILAACVNTNGTGACDTLFQSVTPPGGAQPTDTAVATLDIVHAPARNVTALYDLIVATAPFRPMLDAPPSDLSVALKFTGNGISGPAGIAIDADGDVWIANASGAGVTGLSNQGASLTGAAGFTAGGTIFGAQAVAADTNGNVWVADTLTSTLYRLSVVSGSVVSSTSTTAGLSGPTGLAVDKQGRVWVANFGDGSVSQFDHDATLLGNSPLKAGGTLQAPFAVAIDPTGHAWITDSQSAVAVEFDASQALLSGTGYTDNALVSPTGIAFDDSGNAWIAGMGDAGISILSGSGVPLNNSPIQSATLQAPSAIAIDGAENAWVTDASGRLVSIPSPASSTATTLNGLSSPSALAIDASGNIWTANSGDDSVTKFVGLASPTATPLSQRVLQ